MSKELIVNFSRTTFPNASSASTIEIPIETPVQAVVIEKKPGPDPFLVQFDPDDPANPQVRPYLLYQAVSWLIFCLSLGQK